MRDCVLILGTPSCSAPWYCWNREPCFGILGDGFAAATLPTSPAVTEFVERVLILFSFNAAVAARAGAGDRRQAAQVPHGSHGDAGGRRCRGRGSVGRVRRVGYGRRLLVRRPALASQHPDDHHLPGRALGRGLPRHRHGHGRDPWRSSVSRVQPQASIQGIKKGIIYSGIFIGSLYSLGALWEFPYVPWMTATFPTVAAILLMSLGFPLLKTVIESFDGSPPFIRRAWRNYQNPLLYLRGAVVVAGPDTGPSWACFQ